MFHRRSSNKLFQALPLLEKFETKSAAGIMAVPSIVINRIYTLLEDAMAEGDSIAPFFLHYMHARGYDSENARPLPDLTVVPTHRGQGPQWVKAYKLYIRIIELHDSLPEAIGNLNLHIASNNTLTLKISGKKFINIKMNIIKHFNELNTLDHVIARLLKIKLIDRIAIHEDINVLEPIYRHAAQEPNVWAMQEYGLFLVRNNLFNANNPQHARLKRDWDILTQNNLYALAQYYAAIGNVRVSDQWRILSFLHGETRHLFQVLEVYLYTPYNWQIPISTQDALHEAIKWLDWSACCHMNTPQFQCIFIQYLIQQLQSNHPYSLVHKNLFTLHMMKYVYEHNMIQNIDFDRPIEEIAVLLNDQVERSCIDTYNLDPTTPILHENGYYSTAIALHFERQNKYKMAEKWHRNALRLLPNNVTAQYNLANILEIQRKSPNESNALYLQAASNGCEDSFKKLLFRIFIHNDLSSQQISQCIGIAQNASFEYIRLDIFGETQLIPLLTWLHNAYECKIYKNNFKLWKNSAKALLSEVANEKNILFNDALTNAHARSLSSTSIPHDLSSAESIDIESDREELSPAREVTTPTEAPEAASDETMAIRRAVQTLKDLQSKPMRNLSMRDRIRVEQCFKTIMKCPALQISTKGHSSGSRIRINSETLHLTHGRDRMSPGAQHKIKRQIEAIVDTVTTQTEASL